MMISRLTKAPTPRLFITLLTGLLFLTACTESADRFFGVAVLNTNILREFGTPHLRQKAG